MTCRTTCLILNVHKWCNKRHAQGHFNHSCPFFALHFGPTSNPYMLSKCLMPLRESRGLFTDHPRKAFYMCTL